MIIATQRVKPECDKEQRMLNLREIRSEELSRVLSFFPSETHILELGAGAGWQALSLQNNGHHVQAIDLSNSSYLEHAVFPVIPYDGKNLPFKSNSFDAVYSSNVLEHIQQLDSFDDEIHRVLKPHGIAIHILPTGSWRFWTSITHPAWVIRRILEITKLRAKSPNALSKKNISEKARWYHTFWPNRHGEKGNSLTELYHFSQYAWRKYFMRHGWEVLNVLPLGLFYTGNQILHNHLSIHLRSSLARILGSSTCVYICRSHQSLSLNKNISYQGDKN